MTDMDRQSRTKLRLATTRLFTLRLRDEAFRAKFAASSGWTPTSPIVPCEYGTLFGEVYATALPALEASDANVAAIPVLRIKDRTVKLHVLTVGAKGSDDDATISIGINSINHNVTMGQVIETLAPNKTWDIRDLDPKISHQLSLPD
ncbi:hypothetical protein LQL77_31020 [Rhodococcus cerastii]|nr:hypothetical protein [Rhodococcus cerastii]